MGHVNVIWQGDANTVALRAWRMRRRPTTPINVTGPETYEVSWLAAEFGKLLVGAETHRHPGRPVGSTMRVDGQGVRPPSVPLSKMIEWTADWFAAT